MNARARMILVGVGALLVCVAFYFLFISARQGELAQIRSDIEAERSRTIQLQAELNRLKDLQERAPELQAELSQIRQLVPVEHDVPHFMFMVQDAATEAGVSFLTIAPSLPKTPAELAPLAQIDLTISSEGGYFALQDFIRRLYDLDRAMRIDQFTLGSSDEGEGGTLALDFSGRIFFELPAPPDAATGAEANVPAPTAPVGGTPPPTTEPAPAATP